jgi:hypothetical protein
MILIELEVLVKTLEENQIDYESLGIQAPEVADENTRWQPRFYNLHLLEEEVLSIHWDEEEKCSIIQFYDGPCTWVNLPAEELRQKLSRT